MQLVIYYKVRHSHQNGGVIVNILTNNNTTPNSKQITPNTNLSFHINPCNSIGCPNFMHIPHTLINLKAQLIIFLHTLIFFTYIFIISL